MPEPSAATATNPRVLVAGIGNIFLGDDGFGPAVVSRLATGTFAADVAVVDYGIRGMHLAYDLLNGWEALVLVDVVAGPGQPGNIRVFEVTEGDLGTEGLDAHAMDPVTVLTSVRALGGQLPRTVVVGCIPATVDESMSLSPAVAAAVEPAAAAVRAVLADELAPSLSHPGPFTQLGAFIPPGLFTQSREVVHRKRREER